MLIADKTHEQVAKRLVDMAGREQQIKAIEQALNAAYGRGQEDLRQQLRRLLDIK